MEPTSESLNVKHRNNAIYKIIPGSKKPLHEAITKDILENPIQGKSGTELVNINDLFINPTKEQKEKLPKIWINKLAKNKSLQQSYLWFLHKNDFSRKESVEIVEGSIENAFRAKSSAAFQESSGKTASTATSVNIILGLFKELIDSESTPWVVNTALHLAYGVTRSIRSYCQYSIYGRDDDDAALNQYQADVYGNKVSGTLSQASVFTERKINSWAYTLVELLPSHIRDPAKKLLCLPTSMWWRGRMPAHINQQFFTDFLSYLWHKPLSLFGNKKSIEELNKIKGRDNISPSYFMERHYKNAGLTEKKDQSFLNLIKQTFKLTKNTFSSNTAIQKECSKKLAETIATVLGMWGFFTAAVGTTCGSALKLFNINSKTFDVINSSAQTSQQMIYLPKIVMPMYNETKELDEAIKNPESTERFEKAALDNLKEFNKEKRNLSYFGFTALPLSVLNMTLKFFSFEDGFMKKAKNIVDDLAGAVSNRFFSHRRHLIGKQFRLENPEFY